MKNQVTSIEQSHRLLELGVPAEKASMGFMDGELKTMDECRQALGAGFGVKIAPAFTVTDLLEKVLPNVIQTKHNTYELTLSSMAGGGWRFYYQPALTEFETDDIGDEMNDDLITLLCDRVKWLLSNGYKLND